MDSEHRYSRLCSYLVYELLGMPIVFLFTLVFCEEPRDWLFVSALLPLPSFWFAERVEKSLWVLIHCSDDWKLLMRYALFGTSAWITILGAFWLVPEYFLIPVDSLFGFFIAMPPAAMLTLVAAQLGEPLNEKETP